MKRRGKGGGEEDKAGSGRVRKKEGWGGGMDIFSQRGGEGGLFSRAYSSRVYLDSSHEKKRRKKNDV